MVNNAATKVSGKSVKFSSLVTASCWSNRGFITEFAKNVLLSLHLGAGGSQPSQNIDLCNISRAFQAMSWEVEPVSMTFHETEYCKAVLKTISIGPSLLRWELSHPRLNFNRVQFIAWSSGSIKLSSLNGKFDQLR